MAKITVKCFKCKEDIKKTEAIKKGNAYWCEECNHESEDYRDLIAYICEEVYKIKAPTGFMIKQIKDFKDKYNFSNSGILYTLKYYYEILSKPVIEEAGLGILPYYYDKAKRHYSNKFKIEECVDEFNEKEKVFKYEIKNKPNEFKRKEIDVEVDWSEEFEE